MQKSCSISAMHQLETALNGLSEYLNQDFRYSKALLAIASRSVQSFLQLCVVYIILSVVLD